MPQTNESVFDLDQRLDPERTSWCRIPNEGLGPRTFYLRPVRNFAILLSLNGRPVIDSYRRVIGQMIVKRAATAGNQLRIVATVIDAAEMSPTALMASVLSCISDPKRSRDTR